MQNIWRGVRGRAQLFKSMAWFKSKYESRNLVFSSSYTYFLSELIHPGIFVEAGLTAQGKQMNSNCYKVKQLFRSRLVTYLPVSVALSRLSTSCWAQSVSAWWSRASTAPAQHHADLRIHQQSHDEGDVEGSHRGVNHEGWVSKTAGGAVPVC